jgi:hypothetical protein
VSEECEINRRCERELSCEAQCVSLLNTTVPLSSSSHITYPLILSVPHKFTLKMAAAVFSCLLGLCSWSSVVTSAFSS